MKLGDAGFQRLFDGDEPEASMQLRSDSYDNSWRQMKKVLDVSAHGVDMHCWRIPSNEVPIGRTGRNESINVRSD
jgi:hypothetical protein